MRATLRFDGAAEPSNPGPIGAGFVLELEDGSTVAKGVSFPYEATEPLAEYQALLHGLRAAAEAGVTELTVHAHSELIIHQMRGDYKVRSAYLRPLRDEARALADAFGSFEIMWVPQEENAEAHRLANDAAWVSGEEDLVPWEDHLRELEAGAGDG